jgi:hypothetical protein
MAHRPFLRGALAAACALALLLVAALAGCGGSDNSNSNSTDGQQVAQKTKFPAANGRTIAELRKSLGSGGPILAPAVSVLTPTGENRFSFGLFDRAKKQISSGAAGVYVAPVGGGPASGPYYATNASLQVKPPFQSQTVANDPDAARGIYVTHVPFKEPGQYEILGVVKLDDRLVAADPAGVEVTEKGKDPVPQVGDKAPKVVTPTVQSVGGNIASIDTRVPPATDLHQVNLADVLGKKPVVLLFATPALCQSRVCGPVVDLEQQVKSTYKGPAQFIHMEIYNDNKVEAGFRPQVAAYGLPTEPWLFAIDKHGKIAARMEGAFSDKELQAAVKAAEDGYKSKP